MAKKFLIRTAKGKWDDVSEYVFVNRKHVTELADETKPKYGDDAIVYVDGTFTFHGQINTDELGKLVRYLNVTVPMGAYNSIVEDPVQIRIVRGNSTKMHMVASGETYKLERKQAA